MCVTWSGLTRRLKDYSCCDGRTSAVCSKSGGWQRCGRGWWLASSGCSWCHAGYRSCPPSSPPPWCFSCWSPEARRRLPGTQCACCVSTAAPASPPAESHLERFHTTITVNAYSGQDSKQERLFRYLWWGWSLGWCSPLVTSQTPRWSSGRAPPSLCASSFSWPALGSHWLRPGAHWRVCAGQLEGWREDSLGFKPTEQILEATMPQWKHSLDVWARFLVYTIRQIKKIIQGTTHHRSTQNSSTRGSSEKNMWGRHCDRHSSPGCRGPHPDNSEGMSQRWPTRWTSSAPRWGCSQSCSHTSMSHQPGWRQTECGKESSQGRRYLTLSCSLRENRKIYLCS